MARTFPRKRNARGGFSYLEMMVTVFLLSLCTGVITQTLSFGARHLREQTRKSQAVTLLNTLCAVIQNDLTFVDTYNEQCDAFHTTLSDFSFGELQYVAVETWKPEYITDASEMQPIKRGFLVRKIKYLNKFYAFPLVGEEAYSGDAMRAAMTVTPNMDTNNSETRMKEFEVTLQIFDERDKELTGEIKFTVVPVNTVKVVS